MVYKPGQKRPPGSGRKRGVPGKNTPRGRRLAAIKESGLTPLAYMLDVLRDDGADKTARRWAAKEAAPYLHPKLAAAVMADGKDLPVNLAMTDKELARRVALILTMADRNVGAVKDAPVASAVGVVDTPIKPTIESEKAALATLMSDTLTKPDKMH